MPVYELINPSDPYTFVAPNIDVAGVCAVLLSPAYGAKQIDPPEDSQRTPVIRGWDEWLRDRKINADWMDAHAREIVDAFDSFLIGGPETRADVEDMLAQIPDEKRAAWRARRQDRHRTSLSDIGSAAYRLAERFRAKIGA